LEQNRTDPLALAHLFAPLTPTKFLRENFLPGVPYSLHGPLERTGLKSYEAPAELDSLFRRERTVSAALYGRDGRTRYLNGISGEMARECYLAGNTLVFHNFRDARVNDLSLALLAEIGYPASCRVVSAFLGAPGSGSPWHCDTKDIFVVQLAGAKRWRFARNEQGALAVDNIRPYDAHSRARVPEWAPQAGHEVSLRPGSVLFLPRNWWHCTEVLEQPCLAATIGVRRPTYLVLLLAALHSELVARAGWNEPAAPLGGLLGGDSAVRWLTEHRQELVGILEAVNVQVHVESCMSSAPSEARFALALDASALDAAGHNTTAAHVASHLAQVGGRSDVRKIAATLALTEREVVNALEHLLGVGLVEDCWSNEGRKPVTLADFQAALMGP
jgi:50S ribosomal protein L16 3-hydroxylase